LDDEANPQNEEIAGDIEEKRYSLKNKEITINVEC
jgi:hypothetical protein